MFCYGWNFMQWYCIAIIIIISVTTVIQYTNAIQIHMQAKKGWLCRSGTNVFIKFLTSVHRHEEREREREIQFLKVFRNHTMLTPPPTFRKPQHVGSIADSPTLPSMAETQLLCLHGSIFTSNWLCFKILKFS